MSRLGPYEVHPFADQFPLVDGDEFEKLVFDIKAQGLREPIVITHDKTTLVDGRNRYRACEAAGVDMVYHQLPARYDEAMILDLIVSRNIARRHLNPGQRALLGAEYEKAFAAATRQSRIESNGGHRTDHAEETIPADLRESRHERESASKAARAVGASTRAVQQAKAVARDAPDLAEKVKSGVMALDAADRERRQRVASEPQPERVQPGRTMLTLFTHDGQPVEYPEPRSKASFNESKGEGISWAAWSWNPVTGCLHGCEYCYARAGAARYPEGFPAGFTPLFHEERLDAPSNTTIPAKYSDRTHISCGNGDCKVCQYRKVFVCSMADLYGRWVPDEWINRVHASMLAAPWWEYLLLTKFPSRYVGLDLPRNAWVGTSVDEQKRVRIAEDAFRKIDGVKVKWLSLEPLKEPLEFTDFSMFDWVVIGAQTETRQPDGIVEAFAPPWEWVLRITAQAKEAGCAVAWKPNLVNGKPGLPLNEYPGGAA